jgi:hypothetical protein
MDAPLLFRDAVRRYTSKDEQNSAVSISVSSRRDPINAYVHASDPLREGKKTVAFFQKSNKAFRVNHFYQTVYA